MDPITISSKSSDTTIEPSVYAKRIPSPTTLKTAALATLLFTFLSASAYSSSVPLNLVTFVVITGITTLATYLFFRNINRQQPLNITPKPPLTPLPKTETSESTSKPILETLTLPELKKDLSTHSILPKLETSESKSAPSSEIKTSDSKIDSESLAQSTHDIKTDSIDPITKASSDLVCKVNLSISFEVNACKITNKDFLPSDFIYSLPYSLQLFRTAEGKWFEYDPSDILIHLTTSSRTGAQPNLLPDDLYLPGYLLKDKKQGDILNLQYKKFPVQLQFIQVSERKFENMVQSTFEACGRKNHPGPPLLAYLQPYEWYTIEGGTLFKPTLNSDNEFILQEVPATQFSPLKKLNNIKLKTIEEIKEEKRKYQEFRHKWRSTDGYRELELFQQESDPILDPETGKMRPITLEEHKQKEKNEIDTAWAARQNENKIGSAVYSYPYDPKIDDVTKDLDMDLIDNEKCVMSIIDIPGFKTSQADLDCISLVMNDTYIMICVQSDEKPAEFDLEGNLMTPLRRPFERLTRINWQNKFVVLDEKTGQRNVMPKETVQKLLEKALINIDDGVIQIVIWKKL